jgi:ribose transport system substrate-binding protein
MSKRTTLLAALAISAIAISSLAGCASPASTPASTSASKPAASSSLHGKKVSFLTVTQTCAYCAAQAAAFQATMKNAGVTVTTVTTNFDAAEQAQQVNQAISTRPAAIVIWPADASAIVPSLEKIRQAGIKVIISTSIPSTTNTKLWDAFTGPNNVSLGEASARSLVAGLKAKGLGLDGDVLEITGTAGAASTIGRTDGFKSELAKEAPGLKIVGSQPGNWDQTIATTAAAALFSQFGGEKVIGVYGEADNMVAGIITAADRAGYKPGKNLVVVGSDCTIDGYNNIKNGSQYASNLQDPAKDGQNVADATLAVLRGQSVPNIAYMKTPAITAANVSLCASADGK